MTNLIYSKVVKYGQRFKHQHDEATMKTLTGLEVSSVITVRLNSLQRVRAYFFKGYLHWYP